MKIVDKKTLATMPAETIISELKHELWFMPKEPPEDCDYPEEWLCVNKNIREAKESAIEILEKQIPKEPLDFGDETYLCPCCKRNNFYKGAYLDKQNYCDYCGQKLEWGE